MTATLYHEVSHQLLFETAGPNAYTRNVGNYWVFEGLGTYFETVSPQPDGSIEVGGLVGRRIEEAIRPLVGQGQLIPLAEFIAFDQNAFNSENEIHLHYQQAMALTVFLMQWHDANYRDPFLDYVRDAYRGRIKHGAGRSLRDRLGQPYGTLDNQFRALSQERRRPASDQPGGGGSAGTERSHQDCAQAVGCVWASRHLTPPTDRSLSTVGRRQAAAIVASIIHRRTACSAMNRARLTAALAAR